MDSLSSFLVNGNRVAVVGSRDFSEPSLVESFVADLPDGVVRVSGSDYQRFKKGGSVASCGGIVDLTVAEVCERFGFPFSEFKPDWKRFYKGAGPERNRRLVAGGLSVLVAFVNDPLRLSRGSADVVEVARRAGVPVFVFGPLGICELKKAVQIKMDF